MKLNLKLIIMAALIGIPLVLITVTFIFMTESALERQIRSGHADLAEHLSSRTDAFFNDFEKYITTFLYNYGTSGTGREQLEEYLRPMISQFEHFRIMSVMDRDGGDLAHMIAPEEIPPGSLERHWKMIRAGDVIGNAKPYYSEVYADERTGKLLRTAAFPFPDGERLLSVEISLDPLQKMVSGVSFGRSGAAFIIDERGRLAAHPSAGRMLAREDMTSIEQIRKILETEIPSVTEFEDKQGRKMLGAYHPVHGGWRVVVEESKRDAYHTAIRMKNLAWVAILASALLAMVTGVFVVRSILGPMQKLMEGTDELGRGNLEYEVDIRSRDEMGILARAFNTMGKSIFDREKDIKNFNETAKKISGVINLNRLADETLRALSEIAGVKLLAMVIKGAGEEETLVFVKKRGHAVTEGELDNALMATAHHAMAQKAIVQPRPSEDLTRIQSATALPLLFEDRVSGAVILAGMEKNEPFTPTDLDLFGIISSSVAISVKNIELLEETVEKTRMEQELKTAELVQKTLFPEEAPRVPNLDLTGFIESASETGGDWYGFVNEPENRRVAILMADVTGHGVPAALVTATTNSFFRTLEIFRSYAHRGLSHQAQETDGEALRSTEYFDPLSPDFMLRCLNEIILKSTKGQLVMTLFASVYYYDTHKLIYANAGHNPPMIYRKGGLPSKKKKIKRTGYLMAKGLRLGDEKDASFKERELELAPGDTILFYTDGLVECENDAGEEFGEARLKALFEKTADSDADTIKNALLQETGNFFRDTPHKDDITLVVAKVLTEEQAREREKPAAAASPEEKLRIKRVLVVNDNKNLSRQLTWFLTGHDADVAHHAEAAEALEKAAGGEYDLCVLPIGGGLEEIELIKTVKENHPDTKLLLLTAISFDNMLPILLQLDLPLQLIRADSENCLPTVQTSASKLFAGPFWGIAQYLARGTQIHRLKIRGTATRMKEAEPLFRFTEKIGMDQHTSNLIRNISDELLMNAMYDAPRDERGDYKYASLPRTRHFRLGEHEAPIMEYGSDGRHLAIGVSDPFGGLTQQTILKYLEKCLFSRHQQYDDKEGGAGLGLFEIYNSVNHLIFNSAANQKTEVICLIKLKIGVKFTKRRIESLGFFDRG